MTDRKQLREWLAEASRLVAVVDVDALASAVDAVIAVRAAGRTIYVAGNGGSASTAGHFATDLQKWSGGAVRTKAVSISDNMGLITAWANDTDFSRVFLEQLSSLSDPGDVLIVISVSGSSPNLVRAVEWAREHQLVTVGLLGKDGGVLKDLVEHAVVTKSEDYGWVESAHLVLVHVFAYALRQAAVNAAH